MRGGEGVKAQDADACAQMRLHKPNHKQRQRTHIQQMHTTTHTNTHAHTHTQSPPPTHPPFQNRRTQPRTNKHTQAYLHMRGDNLSNTLTEACKKKKERRVTLMKKRQILQIYLDIAFSTQEGGQAKAICEQGPRSLLRVYHRAAAHQ